jgi:hypothetical protein
MPWQNQKSVGTTPTDTEIPEQPQFAPANSSAEWDYKNSPVNQKGESLPSGAEGWSPFGSPYFGSGLSGTLKRYAWSLMGSPTQGDEEERWGRFLELTGKNEFWNNPLSDEFKQGMGEFVGGLTDTDPKKAETDWNQLTTSNARLKEITDQYGQDPSKMPETVQTEFKELQSVWSDPTKALAKAESAASGTKVGSLLSPLLKISKVGVQAVMDVFSEAAVKFEQGQGAVQAMREYADAQGSTLPDIAADIDRSGAGDLDTSSKEFQIDPALAIAKSEEAQSVANLASRLVMPVLNSWDAFRFLTAPGTLAQKQQAVQEGWDAGRILYSQTIKPSLLEEYKRRAQAGEDPQLLAMELQNPYAEMVGQMILDPLNVVGMLSKGAKVAGMLDDATEKVRGGSLGDEAVELMSDAGKTMPGPLGETRAAERMEKFDTLLTDNIKRIEDGRLTVDFNKATSYSPSGLRVRETKAIMDSSALVSNAIMRNGGSADDIADFFADLSKAVSSDKAIRGEAWDRIFSMSKRFGMGRYAFSDDVLETGIILRNLTEDKDLLPALRAGKGDLAKTAEILNNKFRQAIEKQIPDYSEVKELAENFKKGKDISKRAEKAAATYTGIKDKNKALWNLHEGKVGKTKNAINETMGKFYFGSFGFGVRNASGNFTHMITDQGVVGSLKSVYRDGKFWSLGSIEDDLTKWMGSLPSSVSGLSLTEEKSNKASSIFSRFSEYTESAFAKRIYWKQFRDTMDKFLSPGVALPSRQEFKAAGMNDQRIDYFVHVLKNEAYGDTEKAFTKFSEKYPDVWKRWNNSVSPEEMKGLSEIGITKEIDEIADTAQAPGEIKERINKLRRELTTRANSATDNPVGVNRERGEAFQFTEDIGKATEQGMLDVDGTNKLNILIEQSEKATDELMRAIGKARDTVADPALRQQFGIMEEAFSASRRNGTRQTSKQLVDTAWDLTKKSKKSTNLQVEQLWNQSILAKKGPPPAGLTAQRFRDELWQATRNDVSNTWETYFSEGFDRLTPLIDDLAEQYPELAGIFTSSQKASAELQMYRTAIYRDGKIFYQQPPKTIFELAKRYGIGTATAQGTPNNKQLLATINKYSGQKYKTLEEVPLEEAEKALQARQAGAMSQADAARVEGPKAGAPAEETVSSSIPKFEEFSKSVRVEKSKKGFVVLDDAPDRTFRYEVPGATSEEEAIKQVHATLNKRALDVEKRAASGEGKAFLDKLKADQQALREAPTTQAKTFVKWEEAKAGDLIQEDTTLLERGIKTKSAAQKLAEENGGMVWADGKKWAVVKMEAAPKEQITEVIEALPAQSGNVAEAAPAQAQAQQATDELGPIASPSPNPEVQISPPYVDGSTPIPGQMWKENSNGILAALNKVETHMLDNYGMQAVDKLDGSQLKKLKGLMKDSSGRITEGVAIADKIGKEWRDFALLPYGETKNFDLALSYAFPYQFWYSRSYKNWMQRVATDPQVIANYARIKESMSRINKDSPEWWRYNVEIPSHFLGLPNEHPMSFNLEANIWPLYGLTGTDFNDPQKRQNWMTATVDDMGKFGPSIWAPAQWAIALAYRAQGEEELAQSWAGRIIPQTATIKAVSSYFGQPVELDPGVQMFSGEGLMDTAAMDKYERNRVGRAIAGMVQDGQITQEQAVEVARTQEGPIWDEATRRATQIRAPGQIMSYFLGVGMKARTEEDRVTDQFYQDYYRLQNLNEADLIAPEEYQKSWDGLREKYPFMDALLLSRKAGPDRDRAYAYNVLGRVPPGQSTELYEAVGIDPATAQKFYDSKGDLSMLSESDRDKFMGAMVDLGAMLAIPETATKAEWNDARTAYKAVQEQMKKAFGEDIRERMDHYYSIEDGDQRRAFLERNPDIEQAMSWQNEQVVGSDLMYSYYGGIQALERYWNGKAYDQLEEKFGSDISKKWDEYYDLQITDPAGAKSYYRKHPELKQYSKEKDKLMEAALRQIVEFGARLPEAEKPQLTGNEPQSVGQENIANYANQTTPDFSYWQSEMPEVTTILADYWTNGEEIPYAVTKNLDYMARNYGYESGDDMLQAILISMNR